MENEGKFSSTGTSVRYEIIVPLFVLLKAMLISAQPDPQHPSLRLCKISFHAWIQ